MIYYCWFYNVEKNIWIYLFINYLLYFQGTCEIVSAINYFTVIFAFPLSLQEKNEEVIGQRTPPPALALNL